MFEIPKSSKGLLQFVELVQSILKKSHSYKRLIKTLSCDTFIVGLDAHSYHEQIVERFKKIEKSIICQLNDEFKFHKNCECHKTRVVPITEESHLGGNNVYLRIVATIPDGWALYDTKSSKNDYEHSPFSNTNNECQIVSLKDSAGNSVPDSHLTRIAFQQAATQLPFGFATEVKQAKGNKLGKEYRICTRMLTEDSFNCGFFSVALYNVSGL